MPDEIFTQAPNEVTRYFDAKGQQPSIDWTDLAPHEHAVAFTVAQTAGYDVLDDIRSAVQDAITNYRDYGEFVDDLEPILRKKGWWGRVLREGGKEVQLGSLRRLRTIYWANTSTARAAGEWERIQRTKRGIPFLLYQLSSAEQRRPEHEGWVGTILEVDDTWWRTHYPPNGWLCQCRVRQITRYEAGQLGYDPQTPAPEVTTRPWTNRKTGETVQVPRGIDPGWQTHPGLSRAQNVRRLLGDQVSALPETARQVAVRDIVGSAKFRALQNRDIPFAGRSDRSPANIERGRLSLPVAVLDDGLGEIMDAKTRTVLLSNEDAHKQAAKRLRGDGSQQLTAADYALVQQILETGAVYEDIRGSKGTVVHALIDGKTWALVLHITADRREIFLKSFRRIRMAQFDGERRLIPIRPAP